MTAGELADLISEHVLAAQGGYRAKAGAKGGAEMAVDAYRATCAATSPRSATW